MKSGSSIAGQASILLCLFAFYNCHNKKDDNHLLQQIDEGLMQSNRLVQANTEEIIQELRYKIDDPRTTEKAKFILPKVLHVSRITTNTLRYLDSLKVTPGFDVKLSELPEKLEQYKTEVLAADTLLRNWLNNSPIVFSKKIDSLKINTEKNSHFFAAASKPLVQGFLTRLQNDISINECRCIRYLNEKVAFHDDSYYETFSTIVGQNAKVLKGGDSLEITAGVGKFSRKASPTIIVNGDSIRVDRHGIGIHKIKTPKRSGDYTLPVVIEFTDEGGKRQTHSFTVDYKTVSTHLK